MIDILSFVGTVQIRPPWRFLRFWRGLDLWSHFFCFESVDLQKSWAILALICSKSRNLTTWQFSFTTLYWLKILWWVQTSYEDNVELLNLLLIIFQRRVFKQKEFTESNLFLRESYIEKIVKTGKIVYLHTFLWDLPWEFLKHVTMHFWVRPKRIFGHDIKMSYILSWILLTKYHKTLIRSRPIIQVYSIRSRKM